jgi:hypothetical protein
MSKLMLRGNNGYYCKRIPIEWDGKPVLWKISELDDETADRVEAAPMRMLEALKDAGMDPALAAQASSGDAEARRSAIDKLMDDLLASAMSDQKLISVIHDMRKRDEELIRETVASGLVEFPEIVTDVGEDGKEFTPDVSEADVMRLPLWLQKELAAAIRAESGLSEGEAHFLARSLPG